jgi:hypothetical protein
MQKLKGVWDLVAAVDGPSFRGLSGRFLLRNQRYHERSGSVKRIFIPHEFLSFPVPTEVGSALLRKASTYQVIGRLEPVFKRVRTIS